MVKVVFLQHLLLGIVKRTVFGMQKVPEYFSIEGNYGLSRLIKSYIGSELDIIYTYLTINGFNVYATTLGPSGELFVEKAPIKGKEDLIHRNRKK